MEEEQAVSTEQVAEEVAESAQETLAETQEPKAEEAAPPAEEVPSLPPPRKKTAQERFDELTRLRREAERRAEYLERKLAEKERAEKIPQPEAPAIPPRPKVENFETTEAYEDALFAWRDQKRETETRAERMAREHEDNLRAFNLRAEKLREEYEDFNEMIEQPVFSPAMRIALLKSEHGPEVAYFLGRPENRSVADKLMSLPPETQIYELGKLETSLLVAKKTKKVPSAPPPINPVGMSGKSGEEDPSKMSIEAWMEWDKKREMEKLKKKYGG